MDFYTMLAQAYDYLSLPPVRLQVPIDTGWDKRTGTRDAATTVLRKHQSSLVMDRRKLDTHYRRR